MPEENLLLSVGKTVISKFIKPKAEEKAHEFFYEKFGDKKVRQKTNEWLKEQEKAATSLYLLQLLPQAYL